MWLRTVLQCKIGFWLQLNSFIKIVNYLNALYCSKKENWEYQFQCSLKKAHIFAKAIGPFEMQVHKHYAWYQTFSKCTQLFLCQWIQLFCCHLSRYLFLKNNHIKLLIYFLQFYFTTRLLPHRMVQGNRRFLKKEYIFN